MGMYKLLLILLLPAFSLAQTPMSKLIRKKASSAVFKPTDIAGCVLWVAADSIVGLSNGDPVSTWADLSGNGYNFTQTGGQRPTYNTGVLNGKPVLTFVSANTQYMTTGGVNPVVNQAYTCFVVVKVTGALFQCFLDGGTNATGIVRIDAGNTGYQIYAGNVGAVSATPSNFNYLGAIFNGASSNLYVNGTSNPVDAGGSGIAGVTLGAQGSGAGLLDGQIAEVIYYNSALSGGNITLVNTYLSTKYGL